MATPSSRRDYFVFMDGVYTLFLVTIDFIPGIDVGAPYGTNIVAADSGRVVEAGYNGGYGNCVKINHGNGIETLYAIALN